MKFLFIVDGVDTIKPEKDTSYFLMQAVHDRGHELYYCHPEELFSVHNKPWATTHTITPLGDAKPDLTNSKTSKLSLDDFDVIFVRNNPPFDRKYYYMTLLLSLLPTSVNVVNSPEALRHWNEKLSALKYPEITPTTYMVNNQQDIIALFDKHDSLVLKPIDGFAGKGIEFINKTDKQEEIDAAINRCTHNQSHWIVVQPFMAAAADGDKRIILVNGEPIGAILRMHAPGQLLNNMDAGGTALDVDLTENDLAICALLKQDLIDNGIFFCGIDVIGEHLIEINVTSPTGLKELSRFKKHDFHHDVIKALEH